MRRATLLYNPVAGNARERAQIIAAVAGVLFDVEIEVEAVATFGAGSAGEQARAAIELGADTIFACGGDGTVHDVLQGMLHQPIAALGVIPLGSANVLARHIGLSMNPVEAVKQQLAYSPQIMPVGELTCTTSGGPLTRYFLVLAGAGPDGALVYNMAARGKHLFGRFNYYLRAASLFISGRFGSFEVEATLATGKTVSRRVISAMAVRVDDLGGLFTPLIRGGSIAQDHLRLSTLRPPSLITLPTWFAMSWLNLHPHNRFAETLEVTSFRCDTPDGDPVHVQADGDWLGRTPMSVQLIPNAVRLLVPLGG